MSVTFKLLVLSCSDIRHQWRDSLPAVLEHDNSSTAVSKVTAQILSSNCLSPVSLPNNFPFESCSVPLPGTSVYLNCDDTLPFPLPWVVSLRISLVIAPQALETQPRRGTPKTAVLPKHVL